MERGIVMKKIEATSSHVLNETGVSKENAVTMIEDLKALVKIGIINSNLITVFTEFWLALHSTKKFICELGYFYYHDARKCFGHCRRMYFKRWYDVNIDPVRSCSPY